MNRIGEKAPWEKALAVQAVWPEFDPEDSHGGGRREQTQKASMDDVT